MFLWYRLHHPSISSYYMTRNKDLLEVHKEYNLCYIHSFRSYWLFLRAEYIFVDANVFDVSVSTSYQIGNFNVICLRHGEPLKKIWADTVNLYEKSRIYRSLFKNYYRKVVNIGTTSSASTQANVNKAFMTSNFQVLWLPRNDIFFDISLHTDVIPQKINKENFKQHILYVPTWRDLSNARIGFSDEELENINTYCAEHNYQFLLSLHHYTACQYNMDYQRSNILFCNTLSLDTQELLYHVDIIVTDYSSIYVDFLLTQRPILFYAYDIEEYMKTRWLYYKYDEATLPCTTSHDFETFLQQLKDIDTIQTSSIYQEQYKYILSLFHTYQQWWSCLRLHEAMQKLS